MHLIRSFCALVFCLPLLAESLNLFPRAPQLNRAKLDELREMIADAQPKTWYETGSVQPKGIFWNYAMDECSEDQRQKLAIGIVDALELAKVAYNELELVEGGAPHTEAFEALFGKGWDRDSLSIQRKRMLENYWLVWNFMNNGPEDATEDKLLAIRCSDLENRCKGGVRAYTNTEKRRAPGPYVVACPQLFSRNPPQASDRVTGSPTPYLNGLTTYGSIMLHEFMHATEQVFSGPYEIIDVEAELKGYTDNPNTCRADPNYPCQVKVYEVGKCLKFAALGTPNRGVRRNADTYALFATSKFFKERGQWDRYPVLDSYAQFRRSRLRRQVGGDDSTFGGDFKPGEIDESVPDDPNYRSPAPDPPINLDRGSTDPPNPADFVIRNKKLRIMPLGDSITVGYPQNPSNSYRKQLYNDLNVNGNEVEYVGSREDGDFSNAQHEGQSGAKIETISSNADNTLSQRPNIVLLHAGTNDMGNQGDASGASDRLAKLIDKIIQKCPDASVLVALIIPNGNAEANDRTESFNEDIGEVVQERAASGKKVFLVDHYHSINFESDMSDGLHPKQSGYDGMGKTWYHAIRQLNSLGLIENPVPGSGRNKKQACTGELIWNPRGKIANGGGLGKDFYQGTKCRDDPEDRGDQCICNFGSGDTYVQAPPPDGPNKGTCAGLSGDDVHAVTFADLNGDGRAEYIWIHQFGEITAFTNGGVGNYGMIIWHPQAGKIASGVGGSRPEIQFADLNGDGRAEYLWVHKDGAVDVWLNQKGPSEAGAKLDISWNPQTRSTSGIGRDGKGVRFADLNGDGRAEYLYIEDNGAVIVYLNQGGKDNGPNAGVINWNPQTKSTTGVGDKRENTVFADINGDGRADYLSVSRTDGSVKMWRNHGSKDNGPNAGVIDWRPDNNNPIAGGVGSNGKGLIFADLTGSGRADYLNVDPDDSSVEMWYNECRT